MISTKPYLIRAFYDWITDNNYTPYIVVETGYDNTYVPQEHVVDNKIVLNISMHATRNLNLGAQVIEFEAKFSGINHYICVPIIAVVAIYAKENGKGMAFNEQDNIGLSAGSPSSSATPKKNKLSVVSSSKSGNESPSKNKAKSGSSKDRPKLSVISKNNPTKDEE